MISNRILRLVHLVIVLATLVLISSCTGSVQQQAEGEKQNSKETLMQVNKNLVKTEDQKIEDFLTRYQWKMNTTGTGLRYMIYKNGNGALAVNGKIAEINYQLSLLDGKLCYSSDENGPKIFEIGKGGVETGLEEGILLLREGDRVKFIIPSHLAFGLLGDADKIPAKATLVYDVELLKIK